MFLGLHSLSLSPRTITTALVTAGLTCSLASANISATYFRIDASNSAGNATYQVMSSSANYNPSLDQWEWSTLGQTLMDGSSAVADLGGALLNIKNDPQILLYFNVTAGASDTVFTISTATLSFPALNNPDAVVSGSLTLTDDTSTYNGSSFTGMNLNGNAFVAQYNGSVPTGTSLVEAVPSMATGPSPAPSSTGSGPFGTGGFVTIPGAVVDMSMQLKFELSANDSASGTMNYVIIPEPATIGLLMIGISGLVLRRRAR